MTTTVIYDGECEFCISCVNWVQKRYSINAIPNQSIVPENYGVSLQQCQKSVVVIDDRILFSAQAVAFLLHKSGHSILANLIKLSGPIGEYGYRYVASHRNGGLVALLHKIIRAPRQD